MSFVRGFDARPLDAPMNEPFEIAGGGSSRVRNVLVRLKISDGTVGYGEGAPFPAYNGEDQRSTLRALEAQEGWLAGADFSSLRGFLERVEERLAGRGAASAALGMAAADAWCRRARLPLRALFGGASSRVATDVTITIVPPAQAAAAARRISRLGVGTIKIKVGRDENEDEARVLAAGGAAPRARLILDANQGYSARQAVALVRRLRRRGVEPALFEQPVDKRDWDGLARVERDGRLPVAADESVATRRDALEMVRRKACSVVNVKLMKSGLLEAWDIALICRAGGLRLMIGGMVESSLAMACAAHVAAGIGGFEFIDLDTPLWFARDPMRGSLLGPRGVYDLSRARAGIGVVPA